MARVHLQSRQFLVHNLRPPIISHLHSRNLRDWRNASADTRWIYIQTGGIGNTCRLMVRILVGWPDCCSWWLVDQPVCQSKCIRSVDFDPVYWFCCFSVAVPQYDRLKGWGLEVSLFAFRARLWTSSTENTLWETMRFWIENFSPSIYFAMSSLLSYIASGCQSKKIFGISIYWPGTMLAVLELVVKDLLVIWWWESRLH